MGRLDFHTPLPLRYSPTGTFLPVGFSLFGVSMRVGAVGAERPKGARSVRGALYLIQSLKRVNGGEEDERDGERRKVRAIARESASPAQLMDSVEYPKPGFVKVELAGGGESTFTKRTGG